MKQDFAGLSLAAVIAALFWLGSCTSKKVEASGYTELDLNGVASIRLPAQFQRIHNPVRQARQDLLGDSAGLAEDQNFWAVTHAFAFREARLAGGQVQIPALLVVSRVADLQSFASSQLYHEYAVRFSPDPRWSSAMRLNWKQKQISKSRTMFEAEFGEGPAASVIAVMIDREHLLEAMLLGDRTVLAPDVARKVLEELPASYQLKQPLEDYFYRQKQTLLSHSEKRRPHYLALLEALQKEELDYTPTPRVVVFNPNLAGQFWWPMFDRSGVPTHFAMAGQLGAVRNENANEWKKLEAFFPGMRLVMAEPDGNSFKWKPLASSTPLGVRSLSLLADTRWANPAGKYAFATIEFAFSSGTPELSQWLNALEAVARQAEAQGLVVASSSI